MTTRTIHPLIDRAVGKMRFATLDAMSEPAGSAHRAICLARKGDELIEAGYIYAGLDQLDFAFQILGSVGYVVED